MKKTTSPLKRLAQDFNSDMFTMKGNFGNIQRHAYFLGMHDTLAYLKELEETMRNNRRAKYEHAKKSLCKP